MSEEIRFSLLAFAVMYGGINISLKAVKRDSSEAIWTFSYNNTFPAATKKIATFKVALLSIVTAKSVNEVKHQVSDNFTEVERPTGKHSIN